MLSFKNGSSGGKPMKLYDYYNETEDSIDEQPIDFSKRYDDQLADDVCGKKKKGAPQGVDSGEQVRVYCMEGTPLLASPSPSSPLPPDDSTRRPTESTPQSPPEGDESPLVYSRCSSVCSLNSFEQHSIVDDRSSVFSTLASGVISPSEIPDSPGGEAPCVPPAPTFVFPPPEDEVPRVYSEEGGTPRLPLHSEDCFSPLVQEEDSPKNGGSPSEAMNVEGGDFPKEESEDEEEALLKECIESGMPPKVDSEEEDEDLLQSCIQMGMDSSWSSQRNDHRPDGTSDDDSLLEECIRAGMPSAPPVKQSPAAVPYSSTTHERSPSSSRGSFQNSPRHVKPLSSEERVRSESWRSSTEGQFRSSGKPCQSSPNEYRYRHEEPRRHSGSLAPNEYQYRCEEPRKLSSSVGPSECQYRCEEPRRLSGSVVPGNYQYKCEESRRFNGSVGPSDYHYRYEEPRKHCGQYLPYHVEDHARPQPSEPLRRPMGLKKSPSGERSFHLSQGRFEQWRSPENPHQYSPRRLQGRPLQRGSPEDRSRCPVAEDRRIRRMSTEEWSPITAEDRSRYPPSAVEDRSRYPPSTVEGRSRYPQSAVEDRSRYPQSALEDRSRYPSSTVEDRRMRRVSGEDRSQRKHAPEVQKKYLFGPEDAMCTYRTEDTPVLLSPTASVSDLSVLSDLHTSLMGSECSSEDDELLQECIRSGMPPSRNAR